MFIGGCVQNYVDNTNKEPIKVAEHYLEEKTEYIEGSTQDIRNITKNTSWVNVNTPYNNIVLHPYELLNIHKARAFTKDHLKLDGDGMYSHIGDFNCDTRHELYNDKDIIKASDFIILEEDSSHCNFVAGILAASYDSKIAGVAPKTNLILSNMQGTYSGKIEQLKIAKDKEAVVSNNSWSWVAENESWVAENEYYGEMDKVIEEIITEYGEEYTQEQAQQYFWENILPNFWKNIFISPSYITQVREYIAAVDDFQESGVIVFAAGNNNPNLNRDVSMVAALPELFPELKEAWLVVNNSNFKGKSLEDINENNFELIGNKCGSAKEYCLTANGNAILGSSIVNKDGENKYSSASGSSLSTAMVSGGVVLVSQAFSNHSPEQIRNRILASANNSWFEAEDYIDYGHNVKHGYHDKWGHGVPDFYAALLPILADNSEGLSIHKDKSIVDSISNNNTSKLNKSNIIQSATFGNSMHLGLEDKYSYAYDDLKGGFKYNIQNIIITPKKDKFINIAEELNKTYYKENNNIDLNNGFSINIDSNSAPINNFFNSYLEAHNINDYQIPYINNDSNNISLNNTYKNNNFNILNGILAVIDKNNNINLNKNLSLTTSLEYSNDNNSTITIMAGLNQEKDSLLGTYGNDAYTFDGAKSKTLFTALKVDKKLTDNFSITAFTTNSKSEMQEPDNSLIGSAENIDSFSFGVNAKKTNIFGNDDIILFAYKPNRINDGNINIKITNLASANGDLDYSYENISLTTDNKEINYGITYKKEFKNDFNLHFKYHINKDINSSNNNNKIISSFIGAKYKDIKVGISKNSNTDNLEKAVYYSRLF